MTMTGEEYKSYLEVRRNTTQEYLVRVPRDPDDFEPLATGYVFYDTRIDRWRAAIRNVELSAGLTPEECEQRILRSFAGCQLFRIHGTELIEIHKETT